MPNGAGPSPMDDAGPNARVCLEVDAARLTKLFTERIAPAGGDGEAA